MRKLSDRDAMAEARRFKTLTLGRAVGGGAGGVAMPQPTAQNQMIIANAMLAWSLLAAPTAQYQVPIAGADPYTPAWAVLTVGTISDLAYATPALTLSTVNAEGAADTVIRSDATILTFDATVPDIIQPDDAAAAGSAAVAARRDHTHGIVCTAPTSPSVNLAASTEGSGTSFARADHAHQLDQSIAPTWTALHTFAAHIALSAATSHVRMDTSDGTDTKRIALCGGGGFADTRGGSMWLGGNEYTGGEGEISIVAGNVTGGDIKLWTATTERIKITNAGVITITAADNVASALSIADVGGIEYMRVVSTDAQPAVVFNEGGADIDHRWEASGQANALFVQGSDGKVGIWASTLNARVEIGGTPGPAILNLPTNLSTIDAGLSTRDTADESIVTFGTNVHTSYTGRIVAAKAGACIRCDTRDEDGGSTAGTTYTVFHVLTRAASGSYTVPFQIAAGAPSGSLIVARSGYVGAGTLPDRLVHIKSATVSPVIKFEDGAGTPNEWLAGIGATAIDDGIFFIYDERQTATRLTIDTAGHMALGVAGAAAASALLELSSTTGALLLTRMTTAQRDALTAVNGMAIYNSTTTAFNFYENGAWVTK